ncbi:hypothetical protein DSECCO2_595200 [anaerobic digester metagenome]
MELTRYYQGDDIPVVIELFEDEAESVPVDIDNMLDLIVFVYTDGIRIAKYSKTVKTGYKTLTRNSSTNYSLIVETAFTKTFNPGILNMEINEVTTAPGIDDGRFNKIGVFPIAFLNKSLIKIE